MTVQACNPSSGQLRQEDPKFKPRSQVQDPALKFIKGPVVDLDVKVMDSIASMARKKD